MIFKTGHKRHHCTLNATTRNVVYSDLVSYKQTKPKLHMYAIYIQITQKIS